MLNTASPSRTRNQRHLYFCAPRPSPALRPDHGNRERGSAYWPYFEAHQGSCGLNDSIAGKNISAARFCSNHPAASFRTRAFLSSAVAHVQDALLDEKNGARGLHFPGQPIVHFFICETRAGTLPIGFHHVRKWLRTTPKAWPLLVLMANRSSFLPRFQATGTL